MPAESAGTTQMFGHADLLEQPAKRTSFVQNALAPVLQDRENSEQIAGWIVMNEPEHLLRSGRVTESAMRAFVREVAAAIKRYRPGERVGLANSDLPSMMEFADIDALDFLMFHHYQAYLPPPAAVIKEYLRNHSGVTRARPIFIGEFNLSSPPGLSLDQFVQASADLGYAGVWPWSLRDRINESGTDTTETEPQFAEVLSYAQSVRTRKHSHDGAEMPWPEIEQRIEALQGEPEYHAQEAKTNMEWASRCQAELADKKCEENSSANPGKFRHSHRKEPDAFLPAA